MKRVGVIDCGSNSFTLVIASLVESGWRRDFANSLPVGLGAGGFRNATIRPDRFARGLDALHVFRETLLNYEVEAVYLTGTSALRDARNSEEFVEAASNRLGLRIEVISGAQEAHAIWRGVLLPKPLAPGEVGLSMDIGGGSVEFTIWRQTPSGPHPVWLKSVDGGVVRIKDLARPSDPLGTVGAARLLPFVEEVLAPVFEAIAKERPGVLVGSSGSFDALAALLRRGQPETKVTGNHAVAERLDRSGLERIHAAALASSLEERIAWKGMPSSRAPYLPLASLLVQIVLGKMDEAAGFAVRVARCPYALREGLVELAVEAGLAPSLEHVWPNFNP